MSFLQELCKAVGEGLSNMDCAEVDNSVDYNALSKNPALREELDRRMKRDPYGTNKKISEGKNPLL